MPRKTQPVNNNKAIMNVLHSLSSVCRSDLVVLNSCVPKARITEGPGFQR